MIMPNNILFGIYSPSRHNTWRANLYPNAHHAVVA